MVVEKIRFSPHRKLKLKLIKCVAFWLLVFWLPNIDIFCFQIFRIFWFLCFSVFTFLILGFEILAFGFVCLVFDDFRGVTGFAF